MKIGIIGIGAVGTACAFATVMRGFTTEIVLLDRNRKRARGVVSDLRYGAALSSTVTLIEGDYQDLAGADMVMITAGINELVGGATDRGDPAGRLRLLDVNATTYRDIVPCLVEAAPEAMILVVTDPPDPLADLARNWPDMTECSVPVPTSTACVSNFTWPNASRSVQPRWRLW